MNVRDIYNGCDGEATRALYTRLSTFGPMGDVALNLFRAQKSSARAKVYRGGVPGKGSYRKMAYGRKEWALANLCTILGQHATALGMRYGWQRDDTTAAYPWVLYVDLPTGQVSFHASSRGVGPEYPGVWDGVLGVSADRIVRWCELVIAGEHVVDVEILDSHVQQRRDPSKRPNPLQVRWLWCRFCCSFWANRQHCPVHTHTLLEDKPLPQRPTELRPGVTAEWDDAQVERTS